MNQFWLPVEPNQEVSMSKLEELKAAESKLLLGTYDRYPLLFVRGEGVHLFDEQNDRYLDLLTGIGVNALGYAHPAIEKAIAEQSRKLIHTSNLYYTEGQAALALRLTESPAWTAPSSATAAPRPRKPPSSSPARMPA